MQFCLELNRDCNGWCSLLSALHAVLCQIFAKQKVARRETGNTEVQINNVKAPSLQSRTNVSDRICFLCNKLFGESNQSGNFSNALGCFSAAPCVCLTGFPVSHTHLSVLKINLTASFGHHLKQISSYPSCNNHIFVTIFSHL
ncbi:hypothetical protein ILYODFUR_003738 [Ilyodon furcidens]|uniref:Uncharacterized protein n=1 Tax=Ilyodon furcidens TaxID=33524 RepID=A0ABV0SUF7_9TELE